LTPPTTPAGSLPRSQPLPKLAEDADRRVDQARLEESESMLRSVVENARHFAIYRVQIDKKEPYFGRVLLVSPSLQDLLGVDDPYDFKNWFVNLHPDDYDRVVEANRRSLEEGTPYNQPARVYNALDNRWHWVQTISNPGFNDKGQLTHFDGMVIDLTQQKEAELALQEINLTLEQRVANRTRELASLLEISQNVSSTLDLDALLGMVLDQLKIIVEYSGASLIAREGQMLRILAYRGPIPSNEIERLRIPLNPSTINYAVIALEKPLIISDVYDRSPQAELFRRTAGDRLETTFGYVRCWMGVPLTVQGRVIGMLTLDHEQPNFYTPASARMALAFANHAASAIENARLYTDSCQRAREIETLFTVQQAITRRLDTGSVLQLIASEGCRLTSANRAAVFLIEGEHARLAVEAGEPVSEPSSTAVIPLAGSLIEAAVRADAPLWIVDANHDPRVQDDPARQALVQRIRARSMMVIPLTIGGQPIGAISLSHPDPGSFNAGDERIMSLLASSAVIGIENARLYEHLRASTAVEERNRLARDLHDAVSQTLFSASLIAEVLPKVWERSPDLGREKLDELRLLTRGALAEMRTLLLELRPAALLYLDLGDLLRHLTNAFTGRTRLLVDLTLEGQAELPPDVKEVFYRVAQEALNNIGKHARACHVSVHLLADEGQVCLLIEDDGCGFDPHTITPDNLGLRIMTERAESIGARLEILTRSPQGTRIVLNWKEKI
jgi:PAS domain S-box-containing protein